MSWSHKSQWQWQKSVDPNEEVVVAEEVVQPKGEVSVADDIVGLHEEVPAVDVAQHNEEKAVGQEELALTLRQRRRLRPQVATQRC